jgi:hypothetical protein
VALNFGGFLNGVALPQIALATFGGDKGKPVFILSGIGLTACCIVCLILSFKPQKTEEVAGA